MKKAMTALAVFLGMEALLLLGTCAALGIGLSEMLAQRLLLGVVGGFGFLLTVLILLLLRFLELPEVVQSRGAGVLLSILFPVASLLILAVAVYAVREIDGIAVGAAVFGFVLLIANGAILYLLRLMARRVSAVMRSMRLLGVPKRKTWLESLGMLVMQELTAVLLGNGLAVILYDRITAQLLSGTPALDPVSIALCAGVQFALLVAAGSIWMHRIAGENLMQRTSVPKLKSAAAAA